MNTALLSLLQLSDPALPIGGYAHSWGLETYVQQGVVQDPASAGDFVREMLRTNLHYTDAALVSLSYQAARAQDEARLLELDALCEAVKLAREIREASRKLGARLLKIFGGIGVVPGRTDGPALAHYPVVFGYCAATLDIGLRETLTGY